VIFIESHYSDRLTLPDITRSSDINHTTLTTLFKTETGSTPMEYLRNYRISVAKKHLAFTEVPVKEISVRCGFKTVQHFSRIFVERTGLSPIQFRKHSVDERKKAVFV
jgi:transcriptional regulator GlxA family with amidase domain